MKIFNMNRISERITLYFTALISCAILFVGFTTSYILFDQIKNETISTIDKQVEIIAKDIDKQISKVRNLYIKIINDEQIQEIIEYNGLLSEPEKFGQLLKLYRILDKYRYSVFDMDINSIIIVNSHKTPLNFHYNVSPYLDLIENNRDFEYFINSNKFDYFSKPSRFPYHPDLNYQHGKTNITYYARYQYLNSYNSFQQYYILINIELLEMFKSIYEYCKNSFDMTYIVDNKNQLIFKVDNLDNGEAITPQYSDDTGIEFINNCFILRRNVSEYSDWQVVGVISFQRVLDNVKLLIGIIVVILIICLFTTVFISYFISKSITEPIRQICSAIIEFEKGIWPNKLIPRTRDEIKYLIVGFNNLFAKMRNLLDQVKYEQEQKKKAEVNALKLQLRLLQSQINPHFLHNTLNAISYLALKEGNYECREMIQSLNALLRVSINVERTYISIDEEISYIKEYLKIQRYRYGEIFTVNYKISEEVKHYKIPKLILQPLVENALIHGILPKEDHGTINIVIQPMGQNVTFRIIDDGIGMEKTKIDDIIKGKYSGGQKKRRSIGVYNIIERLKLSYGDRYSLFIFSNIGIGTCVAININEKQLREDDLRH